MKSIDTLQPRIISPVPAEQAAYETALRQGEREGRLFGKLIIKDIQLHEAQRHEPMTGLLNKRGFLEKLEVWQQSQRHFGVISIDVANFKYINDTYGHAVGDQVVLDTAHTLVSSVRGNDSLTSRWGGDEFYVAVDLTPRQDESLTDRERMGVVTDRIDTTFAEMLEATGKGNAPVGLTMAYEVYDPVSFGSVEELLVATDIAMLSLKDGHHEQLGGAHRP